MQIEIPKQLQPRTINKLQELIRFNIDASQGFEHAAEKVNDSSLQALLEDIGTSRQRNAALLERQVRFNGEQPVEVGSFLAAFNRIWINLRATVSGGDGEAHLTEVLRGEEQMRMAYEEVLNEIPGSPVQELVIQQYEEIVQQFDRLGALRIGVTQ